MTILNKIVNYNYDDFALKIQIKVNRQLNI